MDFKIDNRRQQLRQKEYRSWRGYDHGDMDLNKAQKIKKMEKRFGYDFNHATCESEILKQEAETFANRLDKYYGKRTFIKKLDQEQKRERKYQHNLEFKPNRILAKLQGVDEIMRHNLMRILFEKNKYKNRY